MGLATAFFRLIVEQRPAFPKGLDAHTSQSAANDRRIAIYVKEYTVLVNIISAIFNEFWQTNAFFTSFGTVAIGTSLTAWDKIVMAPMFTHVAILLLYLVLMSIWEVTLFRHNQLAALHIKHALELERAVPELQIYGRRVEMKTRLPSVRKLWCLAPIFFSVIPIGEVTYRILTRA